MINKTYKFKSKDGNIFEVSNLNHIKIGGLGKKIINLLCYITFKELNYDSDTKSWVNEHNQQIFSCTDAPKYLAKSKELLEKGKTVAFYPLDKEFLVSEHSDRLLENLTIAAFEASGARLVKDRDYDS